MIYEDESDVISSGELEDGSWPCNLQDGQQDESNAIVPQVAAEFIKAFLEAES